MNYSKYTAMCMLVMTSFLVADNAQKTSEIQTKQVHMSNKPVKKISSDFVVVDPMKILEQSKEYKAGVIRIEDELKEQQRELKDLEQKIMSKKNEFEMAYNTLNEAGRKQRMESLNEMQYKYQSKMQTAQQYAQHAEEQLRTEVLKNVREIASSLRKQLEVKVVFAGGVLDADDSVDITDEVLKQLNAEYEAKEKKDKTSQVGQQQKATEKTS